MQFLRLLKPRWWFLYANVYKALLVDANSKRNSGRLSWSRSMPLCTYPKRRSTLSYCCSLSPAIKFKFQIWFTLIQCWKSWKSYNLWINCCNSFGRERFEAEHPTFKQDDLKVTKRKVYVVGRCHKFYVELKFLTVSGPSTSGQVEGSALSPLPLYADWIKHRKWGVWESQMTGIRYEHGFLNLLYHIWGPSSLNLHIKREFDE